MSADDDGFSLQAQRLLAAYRAEEALPDDVRARVRARLEPAPVAAPIERGTAMHGGTRWAIAGLAVAAALAAVWWGRGQLVHEASETPQDAAADQLGPRDSVPASVPEPATPTPSATPPESAPPPSPMPSSDAKPRPRASTPSVDVEAPSEVDGLADEAELLRTAQAALAHGEGQRALGLLDAGARRFAHGVLLEERAALHVLALCEVGRGADAHRESDAFTAAHPRSPLLARVRSACVDASP